MATLLEVKNLKAHFFMEQGTVYAVNGVSFRVEEKKTLGIVGESGCGKSVTARSILQILGSRGRIVEGEILLRNSDNQKAVIDIAKLKPNSQMIREIRGKIIAMIFQEPMSTLCPVYTIGNQIMETILLHQNVSKHEARDIAIDSLKKVGIPKPEQRIDEYPHQLSGGMLQRAMIAMALSCHPKLLIADEPTTAIDVTTQAQILDLLRNLQAELGMSIIMITHNLGVIAEIADEIAVMYMGMVIESASVEELFYNPLHPYTKALFESIPHIGKEAPSRLKAIIGVVPDAFNIPTGCPFHPRCQIYKDGLCEASVPEMVEILPGHCVRCFMVISGIRNV